MRALLVAAAMLSATMAHAASDDARALKALEQGVTLFNAGRFDDARAAFVRARDLAPAKPNPYRFLGLVEVKLGHCDAAVAAFAEFLRIVPPNDPRRVEATTLRDQCTEALAPKTGALDVETAPPGATVRLDDENAAPAGTTPLHVEALAPGAHVVFVSRDGYRARSHGVTVAAHEAAKVTLALEAIPVAATVVTGPPVVSDRIVAPAPAPPAATEKKKSRWWIAGVVAGVAVVAAGIAVGLAYGLSSPSSSGTHEMLLAPIGWPPQ